MFCLCQTLTLTLVYTACFVLKTQKTYIKKLTNKFVPTRLLRFILYNWIMAVNAGRLLWVGQPKHFLRIQVSGKRLLETSSAVPGVLVPNAEVKSFIERSMRAVGTKPDHATSLADNLVMADYRGHFSHGLNRLGQHV